MGSGRLRQECWTSFNGREGIVEIYERALRSGDLEKAREMFQSCLHGAFDSDYLKESSGFSEICVADLDEEENHETFILCGTLFIEPFLTTCVNTVLADKYGSTVRVIISDERVYSCNQARLLQRYSKGRRVGIKNPHYKICLDGGTAVHVDHPRDVIHLRRPSPHSRVNSKAQCPLHKVVRKYSRNSESTYRLLTEGNRLPSENDWTGALDIYSTCISECGRSLDYWRKNCQDFGIESISDEDAEVTKRNPIIAFSSRAEAWLRLRYHEKALSDAGEAQELDSKYGKSSFHRKKALHGLGNDEECCDSLHTTLDALDSEDQYMKEVIPKIRSSSLKAETRALNLPSYRFPFCHPDPPSCSDFVGAVRIQRDSRGGRGLYVTTDFEVGQLLVVSNALAVTSRDASGSTAPQGVFETCRMKIEDEDALVGQLCSLVNASRRHMHQLCSLNASESQEIAEVPGMDLFTSGREGIGNLSDKDMQLDTARIRGAIQRNAFDSNYFDFFDYGDLGSFGLLAGSRRIGIWVLPSFINHSCTPNCEMSMVGNTMFVRASRRIPLGQELGIAYFDIMKDVETRQKYSERWPFICCCQRCCWERGFPRHLDDTRRSVCRMVQVAVDKCLSNVHTDFKFQAIEDLANLLNVIEETIEAVNLKGHFRHWIRASVLDSYLARARTLMFKSNSQMKLAVLTSVVDVITEVGGGNLLGLQFGACFLSETKIAYGTMSSEYRDAAAQVHEIFRVYYGKMSKRVFSSLLKLHLPAGEPIR